MVRRPLAGFALPCALVLASCGDYYGQREAPPPPPDIAAGRYASHPDIMAIAGVDRWFIELPDGGESTTAYLVRCQPKCGHYADLAVRQGLNGLAMTASNSVSGPQVDLAIMPQGGDVRLTYVADGVLRDLVLTSTRAPTPVTP